jgi:hypothetical protein
MIKYLIATTAVLSIVTFLLPSQAEAKHHHRHHRVITDRIDLKMARGGSFRTTTTYTADDEVSRYERRSMGRETVIGGRHSGDPYQFCGAEAARYVFGVAKRELWLASNWFKFSRTYPAPGMAAVRNHHVMVLMSHVEGSQWLVHDGNSGHHLTREHVRSISGYTIVNPHGTRYASR